MILDTTSKTIEVILGGAITTNQLEITADWVDTQNGLTFAPGGTLLLTNGVTAVTAVASPAANTQRQVKAITVYNADTVNAVVTVRLFDGTNRRRHVVVTLTPGQSLVFTPEGGWSILASTRGQIPGTTTNDTASAGNVGEIISTSLASGSAVSVSNGVSKTIMSVTLTPGQWAMTANANTFPAGTTTPTQEVFSISPTTNTLTGAPNGLQIAMSTTFTTGGGNGYSLADLDVFVAAGATKTMFLVANCSFGTSTQAIYGLLRALRIR